MKSFNPMDRLLATDPGLLEPRAPVPKIGHHRIQLARLRLVGLA